MARERTPTPRRNRKITLQVSNTCSFCGNGAQKIAECPKPVDYERAGSAVFRDNCIVTPRWSWCSTLKEIYPPDGEAL